MARQKSVLTPLQAKALAWFAAGNTVLYKDRGRGKGHWVGCPFNGGVVRTLGKKFYVGIQSTDATRLVYAITDIGRELASQLLEKRPGPYQSNFDATEELKR